MGPALFVINNFLVMLIAVFLSEIALKNRESWRRVLAAISMFPVIILVVVFILGMTSRLTALSVTVLLVCLFVMIVIIKKRRDGQEIHHAKTINNTVQFDGVPKILCFIGLILGGLLIGVIVGRFIIPGTKFNWDDLSYHASIAAYWLVDERLSLVHTSGAAYYPLNAEVLSLWFMLPFHNDALVSMAGMYWVALMILATISLGLVRRHSHWSIVLTVILVIASPAIKGITRTFSAVDLAPAAMVLAGLAMLIPSSSNQSHRTRFVDVVYSGLLVGFAVGCKVPFVPAAVIVFIWLLLAQRHVTSGRTRASYAGVFVLGVLATGAFWYVRNIVLTGNPLFPADFGPFAGPFTAECMHRTKLISWILKAPTDFQQWRYIIQSYTNWPVALFFLAAIGYLSGFYFLRRGNSSTDRHCTSIHLLLLATGLSLIVIYPFTPFSGTNNHPAGPLRTELRFVITPFIIGILLFSRLLQDKRRGWLWFLVAAAAVLIPFGGRLSQSYLLNAVALTIGVCVLYIWKRFSGFFMRIKFSSKTFLLLFFAVSIGIVICLGHQQNLVDRRIFTYGGKTQPVGAAWQELEKLPRGAAISVFGPTAYQYYPLFGRNMQFKPCWVDAEGLPFQLLHQRWRENPLCVSWWSTKRASKPDFDRLLDNLINTGVDYVLDTKWDKDRWVSQHFVLSESEKVERIYDDGYSVIWKIRR